MGSNGQSTTWFPDPTSDGTTSVVRQGMETTIMTIGALRIVARQSRRVRAG
jgi:hypothetical protein